MPQCDRSRPSCIKCSERGLQCEYLDGPQSPASSVQLERLARLSRDPRALSELLATLPYFEALELFEMFRKMPRDSASATSMQTPQSSSLSSSSESPPSWTPLAAQTPPAPQYNLVRSLLPPASNPMEQELMVRHPIAYPVLMPVAVNALPLETLLIPRKPEMLGECLLLKDASHSESLDVAENNANDDESAGWWSRLSHLTPSHIDLLQKVDISLWIDLPIPNDIAIRVIALYLNNDHPVLPLFNVDLFLQDLSQNQPYFCSRLLVSALLGWACVSTADKSNTPKLTVVSCICSSLTLAYTIKRHPGVHSFFSMLKPNGTNWATTNL